MATSVTVHLTYIFNADLDAVWHVKIACNYCEVFYPRRGLEGM